MSLDELKQRLPNDLKINLGAIASTTALSQAQAWLVAVASAHTARQPELVAAIEAEAAPHAAIAAGRGAAAIMGMNNVYYRFVHFMGDASEYGHMPARLRMQTIGNPGVDKLDFELACLAASAITGCEACVRAHERAVRERGGTKEMVHDTVRIAAVLHGVAIALGG